MLSRLLFFALHQVFYVAPLRLNYLVRLLVKAFVGFGFLKACDSSADVIASLLVSS